RSCVRISGCKSESFDLTTGLRQGCVLSPLLFIIFMDRISRRCTGPGVKLGKVVISKLFFADDLLLLASTAEDLQRLLNRFATECDKEGMKISTPKTEVMTLSLSTSHGMHPTCVRSTTPSSRVLQVSRHLVLK